MHNNKNNYKQINNQLGKRKSLVGPQIQAHKMPHLQINTQIWTKIITYQYPTYEKWGIVSVTNSKKTFLSSLLIDCLQILSLDLWRGWISKKMKRLWEIVLSCSFHWKLYASDKRHKGNMLVLAPLFLDDPHNGKANGNTTLGQSQWCHVEPNSNAHKMEKVT